MLECSTFVRDHGLFCLLFVIILYLTGRRSRTRKCSFPFPPGPPKLPFIGNALAFPSGFEWETFHRWSKEYRMNLFFWTFQLFLNTENSQILISYILMSLVHLSSFWTLLRLLRSFWREGLLFTQIGLIVLILSINRKLTQIYTPKFSLVTETQAVLVSSLSRCNIFVRMGFSWLLPFMPYGLAWKQRRQLLQRRFNAMNNLTHKPFALKYGRELLIRLLDRPEVYMAHVRQYVHCP